MIKFREEIAWKKSLECGGERFRLLPIGQDSPQRHVLVSLASARHTTLLDVLPSFTCLRIFEEEEGQRELFWTSAQAAQAVRGKIAALHYPELHAQCASDPPIFHRR